MLLRRTTNMMLDDKIMCGLVGTAVGAAGAGLSVTEIQAIISIIVTIAGFIISVLIPLGIKLYKKIKAAKEDGKITKEEAEDIVETIKEIGQQTGSLINQVKEESEKKSEGE